MRILIGCEESGVVRDAFLARGHEALSCDLKPSRRPGPHYQGDVFDVIDYPWDLAIFHIPCTHSSVSGARHFAAKKMDGRFYAGNALWLRAWKAAEHIPHVCFEHPVSVISSLFRKPDQVIQPHHFGHPETKATCLWLRNLPPLVPTNPVEPDFMRKPDGSYYTDAKGKRYSRIHFMSGRKGDDERAQARSETYPGIADAFAEQWGRYIEEARRAA